MTGRKMKTSSLRSGFSYLEVMISLAILSGAIMVGTQLISSYTLGEEIQNRRYNAQMLGDALLNELLAKPISYNNPLSFDSLSTLPNEARIKTVTLNAGPFSDGDDTHCPKSADGNPLDTPFLGYQRNATVTPIGSNAAKIIVEVRYHGQLLYTTTALRGAKPVHE